MGQVRGGFSGSVILLGAESPVVRLWLSVWRLELQAGCRIVAGSGAGCGVAHLRRPLPRSAHTPRRGSFALSELEAAFAALRFGRESLCRASLA